MRIETLAWLIILFFSELSMSQAQTAIRFGKLIDGKGEVWTNAVVLVRDGNGAALLGMSDQRGAVAPGYFATWSPSKATR